MVAVPLEEQIRAISRGGAPDIKAAIDAATAEVAKQKTSFAQVVVLAASDIGFDGAAIAKVIDPSTGAQLRAIALGRGPQEAQAFALAGGTYSYNGYALAERRPTSATPSPSSGAPGPSPPRRSVPDGLSWIRRRRCSSRQGYHVTFTIERPSWIVVPALVDPAGRRFGLDTPQPTAAVVEGYDQTRIIIANPAAGTWKLELSAGVGPAPGDVPWVAEAYGNVPSPIGATSPRAETQFGAGSPMEVAVGVTDLKPKDPFDPGHGVVATITSTDPTGSSHSRVMDRSGSQDLGISSDLVEGVTVYGTRLAGSYHLVMAIDGTDAAGAPFHLAPETWHYVETTVDTDHDGFGDEYERTIGTNPADPSERGRRRPRRPAAGSRGLRPLDGPVRVRQRRRPRG